MYVACWCGALGGASILFAFFSRPARTIRLAKGDGRCRKGGVGEDKDNKCVVLMYTSATTLRV